jgi:hypothetical protein
MILWLTIKKALFIVAVTLLPLLQDFQRLFMINLELFHLIASTIAWRAC